MVLVTSRERFKPSPTPFYFERGDLGLSNALCFVTIRRLVRVLHFVDIVDLNFGRTQILIACFPQNYKSSGPTNGTYGKPRVRTVAARCFCVKKRTVLKVRSNLVKTSANRDDLSISADMF